MVDIVACTIFSYKPQCWGGKENTTRNRTKRNAVHSPGAKQTYQKTESKGTVWTTSKHFRKASLSSTDFPIFLPLSVSEMPDDRLLVSVEVAP